jgi:hypothetical protein
MKESASLTPSDSSTSLFPESPILRVDDQRFEIRFIAQADELESPGDKHHDQADHDDHDHAVAHDGHDAHAGGHSAKPDKYVVPDELPNIYLLTKAFFAKDEHHDAAHDGHYKPWWVNPAFTLFYAGLVIFVLLRILRRPSVERPGKPQVAVETIFGGLANFFGEIVGPENVRKYVPFLGSLWLFIIVHNYFALIPFFKSPTAYFQTTIGLGICVFCFVNYHGMKAGGIGHYFWHLCGSPNQRRRLGHGPPHARS